MILFKITIKLLKINKRDTMSSFSIKSVFDIIYDVKQTQQRKELE